MTTEGATSTKEFLLEFARDLPEKTTLVEAIEELQILAALKAAQADSLAGRVVSHNEACQRMESWISK